MRSLICFLAVLAGASLVAAAEVATEAPVLLPPMVVTAPPGAVLFVISFESKLPLPFSKVTRASFKNVFPGPVRDAGVKAGDELLRIGGVEVKTMTVMDMRRNVKRERTAGTREDFLVRSPKGEVRAVTVLYEEKTMPKADPADPTTPGLRRAP